MDNIIQIVERSELLAGRVWPPSSENDQPETGTNQNQNGDRSATASGSRETNSPAEAVNPVSEENATTQAASPEQQTASTNAWLMSGGTSSSEQPQYAPSSTLAEMSTSNTQLDPTQLLTSSSASTPETTSHSITTSSASSSTTTESSSSGTSTSETTTASSTQTDTSADTSNTGATHDLSSTNMKLAIALPIAIVGLAIIGAIVFFYLRRRKRRNARPAYDIATGQTRAISTAELMAVQQAEMSGPETSSVPNLPIIQVPTDRAVDSTPGSATARSGINDSHTELGLAIAVPMDQRHSVSQHDLHRFSGSATASRTSTPRMPFESRGGEDDDDDNVSIVSDNDPSRRNRERDFDDMSSVSSFDDDENDRRAHDHGRSW